MSEKVNDRTIFSLLEVSKSIQKTLDERYKSAYWIKAEMNKLNFYSHSGHAYPELVEKQDGKVIAQVKSMLWKDDFIRINNTFQQVLKEPLKDGIKILFLAKITFDPVYGLSLRIIDIDPSYTLGDLEREKQDTIKRLMEEGLFSKNKTLKMPVLPQRIGIISVETSKGYADFLKVIQTNPWGYYFFQMLFPSILQGEKAVHAIIAQLKRIKKVKQHFDVVVIIRGGGGDVGLSCYNHYELAKAIALFPIPVITGIGHATNETVAEMIAYSNAITPTKIAEYLIQQFHNFSVPVQKAEETITDKSKRLLSEAQSALHAELKLFRSVTENMLMSNHHTLKNEVNALLQHTSFRFRSENAILNQSGEDIKKDSLNFCSTTRQTLTQLAAYLKKDLSSGIKQAKSELYHQGFMIGNLSRIILSSGKQTLRQSQFQIRDKTLQRLAGNKETLNNVEKNIRNMDPQNVLKRGYSISMHHGKVLKSIEDIQEGDMIHTTLIDGNIDSIVQTSQKTNQS